MLRTRFTEAFGLVHPVALAPMAGAAGGRLAAAVARAGGLGLLGGAYGDGAWIAREWQVAGDAAIGIGFITWRLTDALLADALARGPRAVMLSFGDPAPFAGAIHAASVPLICQCQTLEHVRAALGAGASVIVAQGSEAGGHGEGRGTLALVPEVADHLAAHAPDTLLLAAGGIADGRGLAAALVLGADGVLVGTRFWAASEALVPEGFQAAAVDAGGDATIRSTIPDAARLLNWPAPFTIRTMRSEFTTRWAANPDGLRSEGAATARAAWMAAQQAGDPREGTPVVGEAVGLIREIAPSAQIIRGMVAQAQVLLRASDGMQPGYADADAGPCRAPIHPKPEV